MSTPTNHLISVIIATYKRPDALDRAIQSVRDEPGDYFDIVIGDDASSDHTSQVVAKHAADKRVRSYCNPVNLGMQENYLKLARFAQGEYVFILTDDDCLLPNSLSKVKQIIERHPSVHYILSDLPSRDERTGKILNVHRACRSNSLFPAGLEGLRLAGSAWVLSRQVMKRNAIDWTTWEKFRRNIYFPIIVAGRLMLNGPAFYLAEPLVMHTFFNQVHWQKFGCDVPDIEFNLAADRFACMRSILHDCAATPNTQTCGDVGVE